MSTDMMEFEIYKFGISKEYLRRSMAESHRNMIAQDIGGDWENLATFIGVPNEAVEDIKEEYRKPLSRRLAMMRRWHELWGKEATYLRLVKGLRQVGRRDLIERLILCRHKAGLPEYTSTSDNRSSQSLRIKFCIALLLLLLLVMLFAIVINGLRFVHLKIDDYDINNSTWNRNMTKNHTSHSIRIARIDHGSMNCSFPGNDLPIIFPPFVGRENDVHQVLRKVARAHIVNINGAPGFGKSTLAIHAGYKLFKNGTSVRYINMEDEVLTIMNQPQKSEGESLAMPEFSSNYTNTNVHQAQKNSLIEHSNFPPSASISQSSASSRNENLFEELQSWSESINCTTILILDNCDDILASTIRHKFLNLIRTLVAESRLKLHVMVVSNEKLFYVDSFDRWTVKELNQTASAKLLNELAPAIDNDILKTAANLVEGCPLALKVIGQLLHIEGSNIIHKLKERLIFAIFDEVSRPEQRFRVILDVAFKRLGGLKDCGRLLSLFPGSFDETAGNAIVHKVCWETYLKHSFLDEYSVAFNYRYKMHRLIKQYLKEKISINENTTFKTRFRKHFETLLLTYYAIKQEIDDVDKYTLESLESHNLFYLRELLMSEIHPSPEELAVLTYLFDMKLIQLKQIHGYYAQYMRMVHKVCPLINQKLCGQMYTNIVGHFYQLCKYETLTAYFEHFFNSTCMEHFQCEIVIYLIQTLHISGVLQLSKNETSYIKHLATMHCNYREDSYNYYYNNGTKILLKYVFLLLMIGLMFSISSIFMTNMVAMIFLLICDLILYLDIKSVHALHVRILEEISKCLCHLAIYVVIISIIALVNSLTLRYAVESCNARLSLKNTITKIILLHYTGFSILGMFLMYNYSCYYCHFMPICI